MHALADPLRIAERGDEEAHALFERDVDPPAHALEIGLVARLDERVEPDRLRGQRADVTQPGAELVAVHVGERDRLHHAEPAGLAHGGDELGVRARVHGSADQRNLHAGMPREGRLHRINRSSAARGAARGRVASARCPLPPACPRDRSTRPCTSKSRSSSTVGTATCATRADPAARFLVVRHRQSRDDAAHRRRQPGHHREPARDLGQVHERDRVHGAQVVAVRTPVGDLDHGVARLEHADARADGARVRDHEAEQLRRTATARRAAARDGAKGRGAACWSESFERRR